MVSKRWSRLQQRAQDQDVRLSKERLDLMQFGAEVDSMLRWLDEAEALQGLHHSCHSDISSLDRVVRQYKVSGGRNVVWFLFRHPSVSRDNGKTSLLGVET